MKKTFLLLTIIVAFLSCKNEIVKKPDQLIEKEVMVNVMYDLTLLDAIKYQNPNALDAHKINAKEYIFEKYKIDSLQFSQNNAYYATDFSTYKDIYDSINKRLEKNKAIIDAKLKAEKKKLDLLEKAKQKAISDSISKKMKLTKQKFSPYTDEYLKIQFLKRF